MMDQPDVLVSIIIPAYNEEARLPKSLCKIVEYVQGQGRAAWKC